MTTRYDYFKETPKWMIGLLVMIVLLAVIPIANLIVVGYKNLGVGFPSDLSFSEIGQLGDFFGGHTSAFVGSLSLVVVLFFTFHQATQQHAFFLRQQAETSKSTDRQFFLNGINLITHWDIESPGCDQCMRLLDYYSRLALKSEDKELLLLLNAVITAKIRQNLEGKNGSSRKTNYPFACEAKERIGALREADSKAYKISNAR